MGCRYRPNYTALIPDHDSGLHHSPQTPEAVTIPPPKLRRSFSFVMPFVRTDAREDRLAGPIRGELLGAEHLAERAQQLAGGQRLALERAVRRTPLLARLNDTRRILEDANRRLMMATGYGLSAFVTRLIHSGLHCGMTGQVEEQGTASRQTAREPDELVRPAPALVIRVE